jgi:hypothetical protein
MIRCGITVRLLHVVYRVFTKVGMSQTVVLLRLVLPALSFKALSLRNNSWA